MIAFIKVGIALHLTDVITTHMSTDPRDHRHLLITSLTTDTITITDRILHLVMSMLMKVIWPITSQIAVMANSHTDIDRLGKTTFKLQQHLDRDVVLPTKTTKMHYQRSTTGPLGEVGMRLMVQQMIITITTDDQVIAIRQWSLRNVRETTILAVHLVGETSILDTHRMMTMMMTSSSLVRRL